MSVQRRKPLINCDIGELAQIDNRMFLPYVDLVNICCGEYASNPSIINTAIRESVQSKVKIGAHPGYPDRENFGRTSMEFRGIEFIESMLEQILYIKLLVEREGQALNHVKAHGALYHDLMKDKQLCSDFCTLIKHIDAGLKIIIPAGHPSKNIFEEFDLEVLEEAFLDRRYQSKTQLLSRAKENAVLTVSQMEAQLQLLLNGQLETEVEIVEHYTYDTLCIHSDSPNAAAGIKLAHTLIYGETQ